MKVVVVVDELNDWPLHMSEAAVITARTYLTNPAWRDIEGAQLFNLCGSYRYQRSGYYVSLLAEARGHEPLPRVDAIEDIGSPHVVRLLMSRLDELVSAALSSMKAQEFVLDVYFGRSTTARHEVLSRRIFELLHMPLLRARFARMDNAWRIRSVKPLAAADIPRREHEFAVEAARSYSAGRRRRRQRAARFHLAILRDRDNPCPASNDGAIDKFGEAARALDISTEVIGRGDLARLAHFDGLFIRDNTFIKHYTYRFSRRAAAAGLVVIDDPVSILRCNNKAYLAELLPRHGIPVPNTLLVHRGNIDRIIPALGLPCVLKRPDSSLSLGVIKVESEQALAGAVADMLNESDLIVAQEYLPTAFDWRVGILEGRALFVCKYHMVPDHWQIVRHVPGGHYEEGVTEALRVEQAPSPLIDVALAATRLIGNGFYGVDVKETDGSFRVIEINDNPNIDAGNEDGVLKDELYRCIMTTFARRMAARRRRLP